MVLGLLWGSIGFAKIDAEKIKTIKCELGSVEQSGEKLSEEMIEQFYKEGGLKTEIFRIKKNRVKSKTFKYFDNLWIKDNVITGSSTADKEHYGVTARVEKSISIDSLDQIELHRNAKGRVTWVFYGPDGILSVPGDAEGTEALFDALVALPGINYSQAEAAMQGKDSDIFLIWQRDRAKLH